MVDNVRISDVAFSGTLPVWATEKTQKDVLKAIGDITGINKKAMDSFGSSVTKMSKDSDKNTKDLSSGIDDFRAALDENKAQNKKDQDLKKKRDTIEDKNAKGLAAILSDQKNEKPSNALSRNAVSLGQKAGLTNSTLATLEKGLSSFGGGLAVLGVGLWSATKYVVGNLYDAGKEIVESYTDLYKQGLIFSTNMESATGGINKFISATVENGFTIAGLTELTKKYGLAIRDSGINAFGEFSKSLYSTLNDTYGFGVTVQDSAESLGSLMESQRALGAISDLRSMKERQAMMQNIVASTEFAKAIGLSVEELQKATADSFKMKDIRNALETLPEDLRKNATIALGPILGVLHSQAPLLEKAFADILATTKVGAAGLQYRNKGLLMLTQVSGEQGERLADAMRTMAEQTQKGIDPEIIQKTFNDKMKALDFNGAGAMEARNQLELMRQAGVDGAADALEMINQANDIKRKTNEDAAKAKDPFAVGMVRIQQSITNVSTIWDRIVGGLLTNDNLMKHIFDAIKTVSDYFTPDKITAISDTISGFINTAIGWFNEFTSWIQNKNPDEILTGFGDALSDFLSKVIQKAWDNFHLFGGSGKAIHDSMLSSGVGIVANKEDTKPKDNSNQNDIKSKDKINVDTKKTSESTVNLFQKTTPWLFNNNTNAKPATESPSNLSNVVTKNQYEKQKAEEKVIADEKAKNIAKTDDSQINTTILNDLVKIMSSLLDQNASYSQSQLDELSRISRGIGEIASKD